MSSILISGTPYNCVRELILLFLFYRWKKTGHFGKLNSLPRVARFVCDGTYPGTQVSCCSPGGEAGNVHVKGLAWFAPEYNLSPELFCGFKLWDAENSVLKRKRNVTQNVKLLQQFYSSSSSAKENWLPGVINWPVWRQAQSKAEMPNSAWWAVVPPTGPLLKLTASCWFTYLFISCCCCC